MFGFVQDKKLKIDEACSTAQEFTKLYYEFIDKKRSVSSVLPFYVFILLTSYPLVTVEALHGHSYIDLEWNVCCRKYRNPEVSREATN